MRYLWTRRTWNCSLGRSERTDKEGWRSSWTCYVMLGGR